jgi:hypothetical protein
MVLALKKSSCLRISDVQKNERDKVDRPKGRKKAGQLTAFAEYRGKIPKKTPVEALDALVI